MIDEQTKNNIRMEYAVREKEYDALNHLFTDLMKRHKKFKASAGTIGKRSAIEQLFPEFPKRKYFSLNQLVKATKYSHNQAKDMVSRLLYMARLIEVYADDRRFYQLIHSDTERVNILSERIDGDWPIENKDHFKIMIEWLTEGKIQTK